MIRAFKARNGKTYSTLEELILSSEDNELPTDLRELHDGRIVDSSWDEDSGEEPIVFAQCYTIHSDTLHRTQSVRLSDGSGFAIIRQDLDGESVVIAIATKEALCDWTNTFMAWLEQGQTGPMPELPGLLGLTPPDLQ